MWELGLEPQSSEREVTAYNHWAISLTPLTFFFQIKIFLVLCFCFSEWNMSTFSFFSHIISWDFKHNTGKTETPIACCWSWRGNLKIFSNKYYLNYNLLKNSFVNLRKLSSFPSILRIFIINWYTFLLNTCLHVLIHNFGAGEMAQH